MSRRVLAVVAGAAIACGPSLVSADDIDLYVGGEQATGAETNVIIFLDNSANWSNSSGSSWTGTQGQAETDALKTIIDTLTDNVNVGLMMHTKTGSTASAYVRFAVRPMNPANRARLKEVLDDIKAAGPTETQEKVAQSANGDNAIEEVFRYYSGLAKGLSLQDSKQDYSSNVTYYDANTTTFNPAGCSMGSKPHPATGTTSGACTNGASLGSFAYNAADSTTYNAPASAASGCAKNYLIWIGNSSLDGQQNGSLPDPSRLSAVASLAQTTANTTQISVTGNSQPGQIMFDEWARFMYDKGVLTTITDPYDSSKKARNKVITYTVDVFPSTSAPATCTADTGGGNQQIQQHYIMQSAANVGGGKCFPGANTAQLQKALQQIFAEIQAVNSVFASASLPVSVNTQGTYENQVYIGMFRPDANARPRWFGNLKEYKFARYCDINGDGLVQDNEKIADSVTDTSSCSSGAKLYLADRYNNPAIDQTRGTGFIDLSAVSYWTTEQTPGFWSFYSDPIAGTDDVPDGPLVERGAAAFKLRNQFASSGRNVYTCLGACLTAATQPGTALATQSFVDTDSTVTGLLTPTGSKTVTLSRSGNNFTATSSGAHGFNDRDVITISGATPSDYNVSGVTISTAGPTSSTFTYSIPNFEKPNDDTSGSAQLSTSATSANVNAGNLHVDEAALTATATTASDLNFGAGDKLTIKNASQSFLNVVNVVPTSYAAGTVTYGITLPAAPTNATAAGTTAHGSSSAVANSSISYQVEAGTGYRLGVVVLAGNNRTSSGWSVNDTVIVSGAVPTNYNNTATNVSWTVYKLGQNCPGVANVDKNNAYCFRLIKDPDPGTGITATKVASSLPITITRTPGSTTALGRRVDGQPHALDNTSVTIFGSSQGAYNNTWLLAATSDPNVFSFGPVALTPAAPSGTATASTSATAPTVGTANLIKWVRGMDVFEDENQNGSKTDVRASIHGDVLHSRPVVLNYGNTIGVVGFYGANDGMLHAVKGGIEDTDGVEKWAFIPEEFINYSKLSRLYLNEPVIRFPTLQCGISPTPTQRDYFWDGSMVAYQSADGTATTAPSISWLFATMRRGGKSIYALDVTNPDAPKFKWRASNTMTDFADLQQTWSSPRIVKLRGTVNGAMATKLGLAFGSGYANAEEDKPSGSVRNGLGHSGIYVVDADTGARLAFLEPPAGITKYSFAADVGVVDIDGDGYVDRIYALDTGGNIFRFDSDHTQAPGTVWKSYFIAQLGDVAGVGGSNARKFLFPPAVVPFRKPNSNLIGVNILAGSGDREQPLKHPVTPTCSAYYGGSSSIGTPIRDRFYSVLDMVQPGDDPATVNASPIVESNLLEINADPAALTAYNVSMLDATATSPAKKGWYITLKNEVDNNIATLDEEKTVNAPRVIAGVTYFGTSTPRQPDISHAICSGLGQALGYAVDAFTGLPAFNRDGSANGLTKAFNFATTFAGGGLPPTVTAGVVVIGSQPYFAIIGGGGSGGATGSLGGGTPVSGGSGSLGGSSIPLDGGSTSALGGGDLIQSIPSTRNKVYWRYKKD